MGNFYKDRFEYYSKKKAFGDPKISFENNRIEIIPPTTDDLTYFLWGLLISAPLSFWFAGTTSTTFFVLSLLWITLMGYRLLIEVMDENKVFIDFTDRTITIDEKRRQKKTIGFEEIQLIKTETKSYGRYVPLGVRIRLKTKRSRKTIATIRDALLGEKIGHALKELILDGNPND